MHAKELIIFLLAVAATVTPVRAQTLINVDFGVGGSSAKSGFAATGHSTNDFWNLYTHYNPRFTPGMSPVADGTLRGLKLSDGTPTGARLAVANAPGVWGNTTGDPMYDSYIFAPNGSNITVTITGLDPGRYHFYLYGHADPDATGEMNSVFRVEAGGTNYGPFTTLSSAGWKAPLPWREEHQFVVFRDVAVDASRPVVIEVGPGLNGIAVLNGLQIVSRGSGAPRPSVTSVAPGAPAYTNLVFRSVVYDGRVSDTEARFSVTLDVESLTTNEISAPLFAGDVAIMPLSLAPELRVVRAGGQYRLLVSAPGHYSPRLEVVSRITRAEPWNQVSFTGPAAAIASVKAQAPAGVELQLLSGAPVDYDKRGAAAPPADISRVEGFLGQDRVLSLRWQSKTMEIVRKSLVTVDTAASAQITPTVIKFTTVLRYELLQASVPKLLLSLPSSQALTRLQGDQIRDWNVKPDGTRQILTVEFVKPVEKSYTLTLFSEQSVDATPLSASLAPPQPLEVERESGSFTIGADDTTVEFESAVGLRQVNAAAGAIAAYRFYGRPFALNARLRRIEPILHAADRVTARLEESRLVVTHALTVTVEKTGVYAVEFSPQAGFVVADVKGEGVEDWKVTEGPAAGRKVLRVSFSSRVLGARRLEVQLEQPHRTFPASVTVLPLRLSGATKETALVGAAGAPGLRLKTSELTGLREIPVVQLASRTDELLAFTADQPDWTLALACEQLPARIVADVFNLLTIGDGVVGGSATVRFGIVNQGVQEFRVRLPAHWKNVEFTGPGIRRKEQRTNEWTISLQDKVWGGYTLVVTYDHPFDPQKALLDAAGLHALGVERETGSVAVTTAASLKLASRPVAEPLRVIDPSELADTDRALVTRPVLLAYRYTGGDFALQLDVNRNAEERVLDAVADRTQLTSVLTDAGEMLTQASFMVKNNDRQFQAFTLPPDAHLWGCYVNNQPVKAERDNKQLLVSLPRGANRDEAFAVDLVYAQKFDALKSGLWPQSVALVAPQTDLPNTYAEWQLYVPISRRVSGFGGNMTVARGTTYDLRDAWSRFTGCYTDLWHEYGVVFVIFGSLGLLVVSLVRQGARGGFQGVFGVLGVFAILAVLAGMMLPALSRAKSKSVRIKSVNNLKQIGLAAKVFAGDHDGRLPVNFEEMMNELSTDNVLVDPESNERYVYLGAGKSEANPNAILAYSPTDINGRVVALADGSVQMMSSVQFAEAMQRDSLQAQAGFGRGVAAGGGGGQAASQGVASYAVTPLAPTATEPTAASSQKLAENLGRQLSQANRRGGLAAVPGIMNYPDSGIVTNSVWSDGDKAGMAVQRQNGAENEIRLNFAGFGGAVVSGTESKTAANPSSVAAIVEDARVAMGAGFAGAAGPEGKGVMAGDVAAVDGSAKSGVVRPTLGLSLGAYGVSGREATGVAGIRSIRIDIPRSGQAFTFTKVLNVSGEPLDVRISVMKYSAFRVVRSAAQLFCFLLGLGLIWTQWRNTARSDLRLAIGLALAFGAVGNLLIAGRVLHHALIWTVPVLALWVLVSSIRMMSRKTSERDQSSDDGDHSGLGATPAIPPGAAIMLLLLTPLLASSAFGQAAPSARLSAVANPRPGITNSVSILSATYTGSVHERSAQFDATIHLQSVSTNQQIVPLFGGDVAVAAFAVKTGEAKLVREGTNVSLLLTHRGSVTLEVKLLAKLGGDATRRHLEFFLPRALSSRFTATIDEPDADVEFPSAVSFHRMTSNQQTLVEAVIGSSDKVDLEWTPRMKRVQDMEATVFSQSTSVVTLGGGVVNTRSVLDYVVAQGELRQSKVRLPSGQRLLRVEGEWIRTWEIITEGGVETLVVDLVKGVSPGWRLTVETEKVLGSMPATVGIAVPHAAEVKRETGLVAVRSTEETAIAVEGGAELQRVDAAEFLRVAKEKIGDVNIAYRFLKPDFTLTARVEAVQSQIEAVVRNHLRIGAEQLHLSAVLDYNIKKAGVFVLKLAVPAGWKVEGVTTGNRGTKGGPLPLAWVEKKAAGELEIALPERTSGAWSLVLELTQTIKDLPKSLVVPGVHPLGVEKLSGFVSVTSEPGVSVKTGTFDGVTEIPASTIPGRPGAVPGRAGTAAQSGMLAFKFIGGEPGAVQGWRLEVATEQVESWIRAEVVNVITVSETLVSGRALVRYDIANAPVKEFQLKVPAGYTNIEISGLNVRRRDSTGGVWRVELQSKVRGSQEFTVTWEQSRARTNAMLDLPGIEAVGVERETGSVAILARPPLQVLERAASSELVRIDPHELPDWAGLPSTSAAGGAVRDVVVLAYRYLRPGFKLSVSSKRFDEAELLQALADTIKLTTVVADDGQVMTEMVLSVRNNGRQFLEIELPPNARVWSAFVSGQPVRPGKQGNKLLLPLEKSGADEAAISVELIYVGSEKFPRNKGAVALASPSLDMPFKNARWELYLPRDYDFANFTGSMTRDEAESRALEVFSSAAYSILESRNRTARQQGSWGYLSNVKEQLVKGNVREANEALSQARDRSGKEDEQVQKGLKDLEKEVQRAQGSNLINAQRAYASDNFYKLGGITQLPAEATRAGEPQPATPMFDYAAEVAQEQAARLQHQQEIAVAKVRPLRVNLPTHGQKLAFTQVLQTQIGKAMTVRFDARNTRETGWLSRLGWGIGTFIALWIGAALLPRRRPA